MKHPFFKGINFKSDLSKLGVKELVTNQKSQKIVTLINTEKIEHSNEKKSRKLLETKFGPIEGN